MNDDGQFIFCAGAGGVEETWGLDSIDSDRPAVLEDKSGVLAGEGLKMASGCMSSCERGCRACAAMIPWRGELHAYAGAEGGPAVPAGGIARSSIRGGVGMVAPYRIRRRLADWCRSGCGTRAGGAGLFGKSGNERDANTVHVCRQLKGRGARRSMGSALRGQGR